MDAFFQSPQIEMKKLMSLSHMLVSYRLKKIMSWLVISKKLKN